MTLYDAIFERHSVRDYLEQPFPREIRYDLGEKADDISEEGDLNVQLVIGEKEAFSGINSYGRFHGAQNYFIMIGRKSPDLDMRIGYYGEKLVLFLQTLGFNSCWVGMTYKKVPAAYRLCDDEKIVCVIAFGFVLRLLVGGIATDIPLSNWIVLMTFLLTLFLSLAKRRDDVILMNETGHAPRTNTIRYNLSFINQAITITATVTIVCYIMYTVSPEVEQRVGTRYLYLTTVFVLLGILRYLQLTLVDNKSGDPTKTLLRDRFLQVVLALWVLAFLVIIYIL